MRNHNVLFLGGTPQDEELDYCILNRTPAQDASMTVLLLDIAHSW